MGFKPEAIGALEAGQSFERDGILQIKSNKVDVEGTLAWVPRMKIEKSNVLNCTHLVFLFELTSNA